jgi:3D (Asp-Asp-Asp) domain-containing protein
MPNLVRGGFVLMLLGLFVVFVYSQSNSEQNLSIATDSQKELKNQQAETKYVSNKETTNKDTKLVKTTGLVTAARSAGLSRGSFTATAYCLSGRTALGHGVRRGIIAADPRLLRLGSKVILNAGGYTGQYLVSDTGGGIKGRRIDIWVPSCAEARRFGRRTVAVSLVE